MSKITFSLVLPPWLAQWYCYHCGGSVPVRMPKGSVESTIVQRFTQRKSEAGTPDIEESGALAIEIPENKIKPAEFYNHVPQSAKIMLERAIRAQFDLCMFQDIVKPLFPGMLKKDLIYAWMDKCGIEPTETNWLAIEKRFMRMKNRMLQNARTKKCRKKTSE